mmetsp:Transcript_5038/g.5797  ORF Transcript_5038/g.5797 Transcript_5038/m.5797 type:complete len:84 (+) Transcript_5038:77-328(+)
MMVAVVVVVDVVPSYIVSSTHLSNGFPALNEIKVATLYPKYNPARILVSETATCIILYICIVSIVGRNVTKVNNMHDCNELLC